MNQPPSDQMDDTHVPPPPHPLTDTYASDIVLLSGWLNGTQKRSHPAQPRPRAIPGLTFLTHISTILTIGNKGNPHADNVVAVSGHVDVDAIYCLIFTENCGPEKGTTNVNSVGPQAGKFDQKILHLDTMNGKKLIEDQDDTKS
jgi:hypothetical protein